MLDALMILEEVSGFCTQTKDIWLFVGKIVTLLKIVIPVIIVILGVIEFTKASLADDSSKEMKDAAMKLLMKFITAVLIFFIPTIVGVLFGYADKYSGADYMTCINCMFNGSC